jgi:isopropylmalate/homocitrate/citramalate synthase
VSDDGPVTLFDVTLREGEQRPGVRYSVAQKAEAVRALDALGVEYVQVGFPVADDRTRRVCEAVAADAALTGLARAMPGDVEAAVAAGVDAVEVFVPASDRAIEAVLGTTRAEAVERAAAAAAVAADAPADVEVHLTAMDGFRAAPADVAALFDAVPARWYTVADTVGARTPTGVGEFLSALAAEPGPPLDRVGAHVHDDLGVATANALAAARAGAGKVDVAVGGLGERAGNVALAAFVAAAAVGDEGVATGVDESRLVPVAERVLDGLGESVAPGTPVVGADAFAHESGLHTAVMLDEPSVFEPFDPARLGGTRDLLFGPDTGRGAARRLLRRADREPTDGRVAALLDRLAAAEGRLGVEEAVALAAAVEAGDGDGDSTD